MKLKQTIAGIAALACMTAAHAQSAGTIYFTTGWFHFAPQSSSDALTFTNIGGFPVNNPVAGTGASVDSSDTLGFSVGYFVTDHISTELELGIPPKFDINGSGQVLQPLGTLGTVRLWSPALLVKWNFLSPQSRFRPYAGIGVTRAWFTNPEITNGQLNGLLNFGNPGQTSVSTDRSWAPVFNLGFNYSFTEHWFAGASISYIPLSVNATFNSTYSTSHAHITVNPIVTYAKIGYRF